MKRKAFLGISAIMTLSLISSCKEYDITQNFSYDTKYADEFIETFGDPDPNQDWSMASSTNLTVGDLSETGSEAVHVMIYSSMPGSRNSAIIADFTNDNIPTTIDVQKNMSSVYVEMIDAHTGVLLVNDYYPVVNGKVTISTATKAVTRAWEYCPVYLGQKIPSYRLGGFRDENKLWSTSFWESIWNCYIPYDKLADYYYLANVEKTTGPSIKISDIDAIVGVGGVFNERSGADLWPSWCSLARFFEELDLRNGCVFTLNSDGPVEFDMMYGGTDNANELGYFYYSGEISDKEKIARPHYIIGDMTVKSNVKCNGSEIGGMALTGVVQQYDNNWGGIADKEHSDLNKTITGTHFKLAYFGEDGKGAPTYTFPKGTKIVFFLVQNGMNTFYNYGWQIENAVPALNKLEGKTCWEGHANNDYPGIKEYAQGNNGEIDAVTYRWGNQIILGFEDRGGDDDMNDVLLFVKGDFDTAKIPDLNPNTPTSIEWTMACEDLGGSYDYDFNDVVFSVSHVAGEKYIDIKALAAGGTLASVIYYDGRPITGQVSTSEIHALLNYAESTISGSYDMLNSSRGMYDEYKGDPVRVYISDESASIADISQKLEIRVIKRGVDVSIPGAESEVSKIVTAPNPGTMPQMIVTPSTWIWPIERVSIKAAYPGFENWVKDVTIVDWAESAVNSNLVKDYEILTSDEKPADKEQEEQDNTIFNGYEYIYNGDVSTGAWGGVEFAQGWGERQNEYAKLREALNAGKRTLTLTFQNKTGKFWICSGDNWGKLFNEQAHEITNYESTVTLSDSDAQKIIDYNYMVVQEAEGKWFGLTSIKIK